MGITAQLVILSFTLNCDLFTKHDIHSKTIARTPSSLTNDVWMIESLQDLCLFIQTLLVNRHLLGCTFTVDLLHSPGRRIQLSHSEIISSTVQH